MAALCLSVLDRLPRFEGAHAVPLSFVTDHVAPSAQTNREPWLWAFAPFVDGMRRRAFVPRFPGLNSPGQILDRMSIMSIKLFKSCGDEEIGRQLALMEGVLKWDTAPIDQALTKKVTSHETGARADTLAEAFYGLVTHNALIWDAQEVLYGRDISALPCEELRAYISAFSRFNLERNAYIELIEKLFWK